MNWVPLVLLAGVLGGAVFTDLASRRIPNKLILLGLALAAGWHLLGPEGAWSFDPVKPGAAGFGGFLLGGGVMLAAFMPFYALRVMGAGDVKLLAVVGAFFGARLDAMGHLLGVALWVLVAGGVLSIVRMLASRQTARVVSNVSAMLVQCVSAVSGRAAPAFDARTQSADRMPYAFAIAGGVFLYLAGKWSGWIRIL